MSRRSDKRAARKVRQTERRKKYGGKTFFGRMIKAGTGIAGGLLSGNIGGALESLLTSQKVPQGEQENTPAQMVEKANAVQAATSNAPVQAMRQDAAAQANTAITAAQNTDDSTEKPLTKEEKEKAAKADKDKMFKMVAIGVGVFLLLIVVVKVLAPKTATK